MKILPEVEMWADIYRNFGLNLVLLEVPVRTNEIPNNMSPDRYLEFDCRKFCRLGS